MAGIKAALGLTYLFAGRQLVSGNPKLGYDLGTVSSLALVRPLMACLQCALCAGVAAIGVLARAWLTRACAVAAHTHHDGAGGRRRAARARDAGDERGGDDRAGR
jgi:hypothetical protein